MAIQYKPIRGLNTTSLNKLIEISGKDLADKPYVDEKTGTTQSNLNLLKTEVNATKTEINTTKTEVTAARNEFGTLDERLDKFDEKTETTKSNLNLLKTDFEQTKTEVTTARNGFETLSKRLNNFDEKIQTIDNKKLRNFKPNLGFCPWFLDMSIESLKSIVKNCVDGGIDCVQLALHIDLDSNNELYLKEDITTVKSIAKEYEDNNIKIKMLKLHCKDVSSSFKQTDEFNTKYIDIIKSICNEFNEFVIDYLIVLNEEETIYNNVNKQTFILDCIDAGQVLGFKTGITTTNFYFMFTAVTDTVKNKCDVLGVNHYQSISNKEDKTTSEDSLNAWKNGLVECYIKTLKQQYDKEIIITETGVQDNWCSLISPGRSNWPTVKKSDYKAVTIYLYGMLETLKKCDELSGIYIWYSINNSETTKLLSTYTKGVN